MFVHGRAVVMAIKKPYVEQLQNSINIHSVSSLYPQRVLLEPLKKKKKPNESVLCF